MHGEHAEGEEVARLVFGGEPATAELIADGGRVVRERATERPFAGLRGFAGTTLLGDGRVLLILDLRELVG